MTRHVMPKNKDVVPEVFFRHVIEKAVVSRLLIATQSVYFISIADGWWTTNMFGVSWLPTGPAFLVAGILGIAILAAPTSRPVLVVWLLAVGLACVGRSMSVALDPEMGFDESIRSTGWALQWMASVVAIVQIIGAEVLGRRRVWSG